MDRGWICSSNISKHKVSIKLSWPKVQACHAPRVAWLIGQPFLVIPCILAFRTLNKPLSFNVFFICVRHDHCPVIQPQKWNTDCSLLQGVVLWYLSVDRLLFCQWSSHAFATTSLTVFTNCHTVDQSDYGMTHTSVELIDRFTQNLAQRPVVLQCVCFFVFLFVAVVAKLENYQFENIKGAIKDNCASLVVYNSTYKSQLKDQITVFVFSRPANSNGSRFLCRMFGR